jgi:CubicO group peptidase (beta-lactamase class C family)
MTPASFLPLVLCLTAGLALAGQPRPPLPPQKQDAGAGTALQAIGERSAGIPRLRSLLVSRDGRLVLERYYNGARGDRLANIKSASKSVIATLVGIAIARGLLAADQPIVKYFAAELGPSPDPRKLTITVEDLLTMRSGLESTSGRNYGAWVRSGNWVRHALRRPLVSDPGTTMEYSTGTSHVLSALLTRVTKQSTWQFAQQALAGPLGFSLARWPQDPQGIYFGGNEMLMTPRQMIAFGELHLNCGRAETTEVVPASWVARSWVPRTRSRYGSDREYGYGWWLRDLAGGPAAYAWGYGGQFIFVVPSVRTVIVTTSDVNVREERREHLQAIYSIAAEIVQSARQLHGTAAEGCG